jgi:AraC-like DNA-binding protein
MTGLNNDVVTYHKYISKDSIGDDFILTDNIRSVPFFDFPYKVDVVIATICLKGSIRGKLNLKDCSFSENSFFVMIPGQIIQYSHVSDDFSALFIIMSKRFFADMDLNANDAAAIFLHVKENPIMPVVQEDMELLLDFYHILKKIVKRVHNPNRLEMVQLLVKGFFLGDSNIQQYCHADTVLKSRKEIISDLFYDKVLKHYRESREVSFYADKLCLTPKYLSDVIKDVAGKTAVEWINDYVILEAQSLLKSTNMNIQEISYTLGFPNQSFFGKFFKKHTGMSPKEYR